MPWGKDEPLPTRALASVARAFHLGEMRRCAWAGGYSNKNYFIETPSGEFLVKFLVNPRIDIEREMAYLEHLKRAAFPASYYLSYAPGAFCLELDDRIAVVQPKLAGQPPPKGVEACRVIGGHLARLHSLPYEGLPATRSDFGAGYVEQALALARQVFDPATLRPITYAYEARLSSFPLTRLPQSIIHGDPTRHNSLFQAGELVALVDWEEVGVSASLVDMAMAMLSYCYRYQGATATLEPVWYEGFLDGYTRVRPLTLDEETHIADALQYAALITSLWGLLQFGVYYPDKALLADWLHPALMHDEC